MKSESVHYTPKTPDLLQSIESLQQIITDNEAKAKSIHEQTVMARAKLRSLLALKKKYEDLLSGVSETIIQDEATAINRGDDETPESYMKRLELAGKTERV